MGESQNETEDDGVPCLPATVVCGVMWVQDENANSFRESIHDERYIRSENAVDLEDKR